MCRIPLLFVLTMFHFVVLDALMLLIYKLSLQKISLTIHLDPEGGWNVVLPPLL